MTIKRPKISILEGDNIDILPTIPGESVDAVITDPPYNLGFMGKGWDKDTVAFYPEFWEEVVRTMKPGAHLLAFGHSRMFHRLVCAIEDAGFEIRDTIMWIYGSGFPKSLDVSKAIDKAAGAEREVVGSKFRQPGYRTGPPGEGGPVGFGSGLANGDAKCTVTAPATTEAAQWQGWGTALKPAFEPIIVARKPLGERTVAANVLAHGTGAINIDACRVPTSDKLGGGMVSKGRPKVSEGWDRPWMHDDNVTERKKVESAAKVAAAESLGRHPANVIHDGSEEVEAAFAEQSERAGVHSAGYAQPKQTKWADQSKHEGWGNFGLGPNGARIGDSGTASRFFYSAKASAEDRFDSKHPTVKPLALMQWLCNLVTPPNGTILDCFAGTGSTLLAAKSLNFNAIGIEKEHEYVLDIQNKLKQRGFFV